MKIKTLLLGAVCAIALASCSNDEPRQEYSVIYDRDYAYAYNIATGQGSLNGPAKVLFTFDLVHLKANVTITNLELEKGESRSYALQELPFTVTNEGYTFDVASAMSTSLVGQVEFKDIKIRIRNVFVDNKIYGVYDVAFEVDGYKVNLLENDAYNVKYGSTEVTTIATGDKYDNEGIAYNVQIDNDRAHATIYMRNVKLAAAMPALAEIVIPGVELTPNIDGYTLAAERIVPTFSGNPFERYVVTNLSGVFKSFGAFDLDMTMGGAYQVKAELK